MTTTLNNCLPTLNDFYLHPASPLNTDITWCETPKLREEVILAVDISLVSKQQMKNVSGHTKAIHNLGIQTSSNFPFIVGHSKYPCVHSFKSISF